MYAIGFLRIGGKLAVEIKKKGVGINCTGKVLATLINEKLLRSKNMGKDSNLLSGIDRSHLLFSIFYYNSCSTTTG